MSGSVHRRTRLAATVLGSALLALSCSGDSGTGPSRPGAPAKLAFTTQPPASVVAGTSVAPAVEVSVLDAQGRLVPSATQAVTIALTAGAGRAGARLGGTLTVAAAGGVATFADLTIDSAGSGYSLRATASPLAAATSSAFVVGPGAAARLAFTAQPASSFVGVAIAPAVRVAVVDAQGNVATGSTAAVMMAITGGSGTAGAALGGTVTRPAVAGVASFTDLTIDSVGTGYTLSASAAGLAGAASVAFDVSRFTADIAVVAAEWTQAAQDPEETIPMVLGGNGAALNVLLSASRAIAVPEELLLRITDATSGAIVRSDTITLAGLPAGARGYDAPSAQFFLPAAALRAGLAWEVVRDPRGALADDSSANDRYPRAGPAALDVVAVAPLKLHFVPITLTSHGGITGNVSSANVGAYLQTLLSVHPVGALQAVVGAGLTSAASFGSPPSGGGAAFWQQVLGEVDLARLADPANVDAHWIGVVAPPAGFTWTAYGGFGYVPSSYASTGPGTKTSVLVNVGWFNNPTQTRDLVAHELGHNFGRLHAPGCGAGSPIDAAFPVPDGTIGTPGHDAYQRSLGVTSSALTVPASTGDVMGYCFPVWSSPYTYRAVMDFRSTTAPSPPAARAVPVLAVRGWIENGTVTLRPALTLTAVPSAPEPGPYSLEGVGEDGGVLFRYTFAPARLDHSGARPFLFTIPLSDDVEQTLQAIRVSGGGVSQVLSRESRPPGLQAAAPVAPAAERGAGGVVRVACAAAGTRAIAVQDSRTGALLGTAEGPAMAASAASGAMLVVTCSDGIRSQRTVLVAP